MSQDSEVLPFTLVKTPLILEVPAEYSPNSLLIFPGATRKNTSDTTLYDQKSDSTTFAGHWSLKNKPLLSLPAASSLTTAETKMKAIWEAVGAGFEPVLPLKPFNPAGPFAKVGETHIFTDEQGHRWEPDFGRDEDNLDEVVAEYYLSNLKLLFEFIKNPQTLAILKKISPDLLQAYEKGQRQKNLPILGRDDKYLLPLIKKIKYAEYLNPEEKQKLADLINQNKITEAFRDNFQYGKAKNKPNLKAKVIENEKLLRKFFPIHAFVLDFIKTEDDKKILLDILAVLILFEQRDYDLALDCIKKFKTTDKKCLDFLAKFKEKIECETSVIKKMVYDECEYTEKYELADDLETQTFFINQIREKILASVDDKNPRKVLELIKNFQTKYPQYNALLSELKKKIECKTNVFKEILHEAFENYLSQLKEESDLLSARGLLDLLLQAESREALNTIIADEIKKLQETGQDGFNFETHTSSGLLLITLNKIYSKINPYSLLFKSFHKSFDLYFAELINSSDQNLKMTFQKMQMELEGLLILAQEKKLRVLKAADEESEFDKVIATYQSSYPHLSLFFEKFKAKFENFKKYGIDYKEKQERIKILVNSTGKTKQQKAAEISNFVAGKIDQGYLAMVLTFLSNVGKASKDILLKNAHYLFPVSFVFKAIDFISYAVKFYAAPNKNLGRFANLLIKAVETAVIGFATFGAAALAPVIIAGATIAVGPLTFATVIGATFFYNLGRQFYFLYQSYKAFKQGDKETQKFFWDKAKETGKNVVMLGVVLATLITSLVIPPVGIVMSGIVGGVAIAAVGVVVASAILRGTAAGDFLDKKIIKPVVNFLKKLIGRSPDKTVENTLRSHSSHNQTHNQSEIKMEKSLGMGGYNNHSALQPLPLEAKAIVHSLTNLIKDIDQKRMSLRKQINETKNSIKEDYLWSQNDKRSAKEMSLEFLQNIFINQFLPVIEKLKKDNIHEKSFKNGDKVLFKYTNMQDFIEKMDKHVIDSYAKVYQSFFSDVGEVESCFRRAYQLLLTLYHLPPEEQAAAIEEIKPKDIAVKNKLGDIASPANELVIKEDEEVHLYH